MEDYNIIQDKARRLEALINLCNNLRDNEKREPIPFNDFLYLASTQPEMVFRDVYQIFYDMIHYYIPEGKDDFDFDSEHVGFVDYDCSKLFVDNCDEPFFADRLFANRLMNLAKSFRSGSQTNRIYLFEGPPGSGKSTFLNNLLFKFEEYTKSITGNSFKTFWRLDVDKLGGYQHLDNTLNNIKANQSNNQYEFQSGKINYPEKILEFSCPNHDHPILQIPKSFRRKFLDELITDEVFKEKLFNERQYEWVFKDVPCSICSSIFKALLERLEDPIEIFNMISARGNYFNRQLGEGLSVFNPGDFVTDKPITKPDLQVLINELLKDDEVKYVFSYLAKTNNGILALMDIKENNVERLKNYHGIISDGVHKVELTEENIKTLFLGLVNPEDKVHYEKIESFRDRVITVKIPYILDFNMEVAIYKDKFGEKIESLFLPRVLDNFAKIIISSRLAKNSLALKNWILKPENYAKYLDKNMLLLKMELYTGKIPNWLSEEDIKKFDKKTRKAIINESDSEGFAGISGRRSLTVFNSFIQKFANNEKLITMDLVKQFFERNKQSFGDDIPQDFIDKLEDLYDYNVLQEVKEAIYDYNESIISRDIQNYLYAINFEIGETKKCEYTNDVIEITEDYLQNFEARILKPNSTVKNRKDLRAEIHREYIKSTLSIEIRVENRKIDDTSQFKNLFDKYTRNLKENALAPYIDNENFRRAIQDFNTPAFENYDDRMKRDINLLISNLKMKFKYSDIGAKQVSLYVLENNLVKKY